MPALYITYQICNSGESVCCYIVSVVGQGEVRFVGQVEVSLVGQVEVSVAGQVEVGVAGQVGWAWLVKWMSA